MARIIKPITDQEQTERRARVARAVASGRLEGLEPTEAVCAVFDRYVAGDLTTQEMAAEIRALNARQFGPIHHRLGQSDARADDGRVPRKF